MGESNQLQVLSENIITPIRADIIDMAGSDQAVAKISSAFRVALAENPDLMKCTPESLQRELLKCAADGLVPDSKQAVILYYKRKSGEYEANYQPMYQGLIKRMRELGGVFHIACEVVREKDKFHFDTVNPEQTSHTFNIFKEDRGEVVGAFAIFKDKEGRIMHQEVMTKSQLERVKAASEKKMGKESPAWKDWYEEMCRKAVIRRSEKFISTLDEKLSEMITRLDSMFDFTAKAEPDRSDPFGLKTKLLDSPNSSPANADEGDVNSTETPQTSGAKGSTQPEPGPAGDAPEVPGDGVEKVGFDDVQAMSDEAWKAERTKKAADEVMKSFQDQNDWDKRGGAEEIQQLARQVCDVHRTRVSAKDKEKADSDAVLALAQIGIESPETSDA